MKREMILIVWIFASFQLVFAQIEVRKPSVEVFINGKMYENGDEITVQKGEMLEVRVSQKGGRRDFVNYPDNYMKMTPDLQILKKGVNGLVYVNKGTKSEWRLLSEDAIFSSDEQLTIKENTSAFNEVSVRVGGGDFSRTYLKINLNTVWQFTTGNEQKLEQNDSEAYIYLNVTGSTEIWFASKNIHVAGTKDEGIKEKLNFIQNNFDTIESNLIHFNYVQVQKDIRNLQSNVNLLSSYLQQLKSNNPAFRIEIHFVGLPSDRPINDLNVFERLQLEWSRLNTFIQQEVAIMNDASTGNTEKLKASMQKYLSWQYGLPENWIAVMELYLPQINSEKILVSPQLQALIEDNQESKDIGSSLELIKAFFNQRIENIDAETKQIVQTKNRLQAVKLFDGMLRSYISSINWAEWENTREVGFAYVK